MRFVLSVFVLASLVSVTRGATIVAPGSSASTNGNAQGPSPLRSYGIGGSRVQQVYDHSLFSSVSQPQLISAIQFRPLNGSPGFLFGSTVTVSNILIDLSTTPHSGEGANPLSMSFADNVGPDSTLVYSGALILTTAATGTPAGPKAFDYTITLQTPFLYDPSLGNLLLDVHIPVVAIVGGNGALGFLNFDTVTNVNDGIYSVLGPNVGAATFGQLSTTGVITSFVTTAVPEPSSIVLGTLGMAALLAWAWRGRPCN